VKLEYVKLAAIPAGPSLPPGQLNSLISYASRGKSSAPPILEALVENIYPLVR
jgi:hypothetical protein